MEDRFVVARGALRLGLLEQGHGMPDPIQRGTGGRVAGEQGLPPPFANHPVIIGLRVAFRKLREHFPGLLEADAVSRPPELIGETQEEHRHRLFVLRVHPENVAADALRLARLVEEAVALGFRQSGRDRLS